MNAEQRRRTSKLSAAPAGPVPGPAESQTASEKDAQQDSQEDSQPDRQPGRQLVSFNCKLDRQLQRAIRHHAVDTGLRIQDIVDQALREYLATRETRGR